MGKYLKLIIIIFLIITLSPNCYALENSNEFDEFLEIVPEEYSGVSQQDVYKEISFNAVASKIINALLSAFKKTVNLMLSVCGLILAYSVVKKLNINESGINNTVFSAFSVTAIVLCVGAIDESISAVKNSVDTTKVFSSAAIPIILSLCIASASSFSGAVFSTSVSFISIIMETVSKNLLIPLTVVYLSFALVNNFSSYISLMSVEQQIKKFIKWVIGLFITLFSFTMTLQNFLSAASDSVLKRSIKSAVGSFVPIVGSTLSSSIDSIFAIAANSKTAISVLGILVIFVTFLPALSLCLCYGLSMSFAKFFALLINEEKMSKTVGLISEVFYLLCAICSACIVMMILSFLMICINIG